MMKRVMVIGPSGAGKSVFSRKLRDKTGLPVYHLDNIWWKEDKTHITKEEFDEKLAELVAKDEWIIDGDYSRTYELRVKAADTVFFLDYPLEVCLAGAEGRIGIKREDIPWVEEKFDPDFKEWIIDWRKNKMPLITALFEKYKDEKSIIIFKSRSEADDFLDNLK